MPEKIASKSDIKLIKLLISLGANQLLIKNGAEFEIDCLRILRAPLLTRKPGYLETLKALLAAGADPNHADLRATPVLATALDLPLTDSPLGSPDFEAAQILIDAGADVNRMYGNKRAGTTLLHRAVWRYRLDVFNFLLEN